MRHRSYATAIALLMGVSGCGSSRNKETISGNSSALAALVGPTTCQDEGLPLGSQSLSILSIVIVANGALTDACSLLTDLCTNYSNTRYVLLFIENFDQTGATVSPVEPGTYQLVQKFNNVLTGAIAFAAVAETDASCNVVENTSGDGSTGTITIVTIAATSMTGSFDVTVDGVEYQGDLNATICPQSDFTVTWNGCNGTITSASQTCSGSTQCLALPPAAG